MQQLSSLAVTKDGPCDVAVLELRCADLAGICAVRLIEDILCCNLDPRAEMFASEKKVQGWRRYYDL